MKMLVGPLLFGGFISTVLFMLGCAPKFHPATNAHSQHPKLLSHQFIASDGARLPLTVWKQGDLPQALVVAIHGFNDYRRAFDLPGKFFANQGIHVYAYDQRGFGDTEHRGMWPGAMRLQDDLIDLVMLLKQRYPGVPLFLLGDSMGAAIVALAATNPLLPVIDGIILNAPAVWGKETFNVFYRFGLWTLAHTVPWMEVTGEGVSITVTDNIKLLKDLSRDPLMIRETRIDALHGMVRLMDSVLDAAPSLEVPTLILYGLRDEVIPRKSVCHFAHQLRTSVQMVFYEDGYHFLLRDLKAEQVWYDILSWILNETRKNEILSSELCGKQPS